MTEKNMIEQLTVTTENEVSIISQNPFYLNDLFSAEPVSKKELKISSKTNFDSNVNRSVNILPSLEI